MGYLNPFSYDLITPFKSSISASTTITNILIAAEFEYIDYSSIEFFTNNFDTENQIISSIYQNTENIKIGAELKISPLVFRVGYTLNLEAHIEIMIFQERIIVTGWE